MARITIVPDDNTVIVDGEARREISMAGIDPTIHAVQWKDTAGEIEYNDGKRHKKIVSISPFQSFIDRWANAAIPPPTLDDLKATKKADFVTEGVKRVAAQIPDWDSIETIKTVSGLWVSHLATNATPAQLKAKNIYLYVRDTVPGKIAAITTEADLAAIDASAADPFGDGTPWPT